MYAFSILFKGSQSLSNMKSQRCHICTAVSLTQLSMSQPRQSGVNDTAVPCALCSRVRFPYKNSASNYSRRYFKNVWLHKGVIDTAVQPTLLIIFANSKPYSKRVYLTCVSGTKAKLFDEKKTQRLKISCQGPVKHERYFSTAKLNKTKPR
jgi:hypothetical protein